MDYNDILTSIAGTTPFVTFLIWYILSERKARQDDKIYTRKKNDERDQAFTELLLKNHEVLDGAQDVMKALANKYDDLKKMIEKELTEINKDVKDIYKKLGESDV